VEHETHEASDMVFKEVFEQLQVHTLYVVSQVFILPVQVFYYLQRLLSETH